jgi:hypothetical protein
VRELGCALASVLKRGTVTLRKIAFGPLGALVSNSRIWLVPDKRATDDLRSYVAAAGHAGIARPHKALRARSVP